MEQPASHARRIRDPAAGVLMPNQLAQGSCAQNILIGGFLERSTADQQQVLRLQLGNILRRRAQVKKRTGQNSPSPSAGAQRSRSIGGGHYNTPPSDRLGCELARRVSQVEPDTARQA